MGHPRSGRRNLVFVRAGAGSLHPSWFTDEREFDLVVDAWGPDAAGYEGTCDVLFRGLAQTLPQAFYRFITDDPSILDDYDVLWQPDDDIDTDVHTVNALFALHRELGYDVAQPALSEDSYFGHLITLQHRGFSVRQVDFVESMVPIFTSEALAHLIGTYGESLSARGIDAIWPSLLAPLGGRFAIYDCLPVRHSRPVGGEQGLSVDAAQREAVLHVDSYGLPPIILPKTVIAGWDEDFERIPSAGFYKRVAGGVPPFLKNAVDPLDVHQHAVDNTRQLLAEGRLV